MSDIFVALAGMPSQPSPVPAHPGHVPHGKTSSFMATLTRAQREAAQGGGDPSRFSHDRAEDVDADTGTGRLELIPDAVPAGIPVHHLLPADPGAVSSLVPIVSQRGDHFGEENVFTGRWADAQVGSSVAGGNVSDSMEAAAGWISLSEDTPLHGNATPSTAVAIRTAGAAVDESAIRGRAGNHIVLSASPFPSATVVAPRGEGIDGPTPSMASAVVNASPATEWRGHGHGERHSFADVSAAPQPRMSMTAPSLSLDLHSMDGPPDEAALVEETALAKESPASASSWNAAPAEGDVDGDVQAESMTEGEDLAHAPGGFEESTHEEGSSQRVRTAAPGVVRPAQAAATASPGGVERETTGASGMSHVPESGAGESAGGQASGLSTTDGNVAVARWSSGADGNISELRDVLSRWVAGSSDDTSWSEDVESIRRMIQRVESASQGDAHVVRMRLHPAHLGDLDLRLAVEKGVLTAQFVAQSAHVKTMIESALPELRFTLQQHGVEIHELTVTVDAGSHEGPSSGGQFADEQGLPVHQHRLPRVEVTDPATMSWEPGASTLSTSEGIDLWV